MCRKEVKDSKKESSPLDIESENTMRYPKDSIKKCWMKFSRQMLALFVILLLSFPVALLSGSNTLRAASDLNNRRDTDVDHALGTYLNPALEPDSTFPNFIVDPVFADDNWYKVVLENLNPNEARLPIPQEIRSQETAVGTTEEKGDWIVPTNPTI